MVFPGDDPLTLFFFFSFGGEGSFILGWLTADGTKGLLNYYGSLKLCDLAEQPQM